MNETFPGFVPENAKLPFGSAQRRFPVVAIGLFPSFLPTMGLRFALPFTAALQC